MDTSEPTDPSPHGSVAADELRTDELRTDEPRTDEPRTDEPGEAAPGEAAPGEAAPPPGGGDDAPFPGLTWGKVAVLGLALMFLGFAVGFVVTRDRPPASDSADVGFLQDMITHHDQALGVATLTVAYGEDPTVRSYAMEVLTFQSYEIGVMTQTLAGWGFSRGDRSDEAMAWMDMGVPVEQMPGLLSEEDLDRVGDARGAEIDGLFLELMAEHHRGGIHMAQEAASRVDDDEVAELAARMERNQAGEINEYRVTAETLGLDLEIEPAAVPPADLPPVGD